MNKRKGLFQVLMNSEGGAFLTTLLMILIVAGFFNLVRMNVDGSFAVFLKEYRKDSHILHANMIPQDGIVYAKPAGVNNEGYGEEKRQIDFGNVLVQEDAKSVTASHYSFSIFNDSGSIARIRIALEPDPEKPFTFITDCSDKIDPCQKCKVTVTFEPKVSGKAEEKFETTLAIDVEKKRLWIDLKGKLEKLKNKKEKTIMEGSLKRAPLFLFTN